MKLQTRLNYAQMRLKQQRDRETPSELSRVRELARWNITLDYTLHTSCILYPVNTYPGRVGGGREDPRNGIVNRLDHAAFEGQNAQQGLRRAASCRRTSSHLRHLVEEQAQLLAGYAMMEPNPAIGLTVHRRNDRVLLLLEKLQYHGCLLVQLRTRQPGAEVLH